MPHCLSTTIYFPLVGRLIRQVLKPYSSFRAPIWDSIEPISSRRHSPICILNDDVLLNIFHLYQLDVQDEYEGYPMSSWRGQRWWYKLAHVSRHWRYVILGSPLRLDLHLVCTYGVPVADMLAHSPPLPLTVLYTVPGRKMTAEDEEGALLALSHCDRVHRVALRMPAPDWGKFITALDDQFPTLDRLYMRSQDKDTSLVLPQGFQAPNLHHLTLWYIALPMRSPLLTTTGGLVSLRLVGIPRSAYFSPGYILTWLSLLPQLKILVIIFNSPVPNQDVIRQLSEIPTMTHVTLPNLRSFHFKGVSAYLEGLLERITVPVLRSLNVEFSNQLTFTVPQLSQFLQTSQNFAFHNFKLTFKSSFVSLIAWPHQKNRNPLELWISCNHFDWQVVSAAQIIRTLSPVLSVVDNLILCYKEHSLSSEWHSEVDLTQWRELLSPFSNVRTLHVPKELVGELSRSLCSEDGEESLGLLPNLQELQYSGGGSGVRDALTLFINERQTAGHPGRLTPILDGDE
jgi:hypothetical protein